MKVFLACALALASIAVFAGTNNLPVVTSNIIQRSHVNQFQTAFAVDQVPRSTAGTVTSLAGSIGSSTYNWLKEFIASGGWSLGDIKVHHTYNGTAPIGEGWMLCDGRQITEAAYNTEHGSAHWATYVVSSPLLNKYLPNFTSRYPVGKSTTPQSGSIAITAVGTSGNVGSFSHSHSVVAGGQLIYKGNSGATADQLYDNGDIPIQSLIAATAKNSLSILVGNSSTLSTNLSQSFYPLRVSNSFTSIMSEGGTGTTDLQLGSASVQPDSIEVQYYMRVIE